MTAEKARTTRLELWKRLGAPTDQEGSVNDPRTQETDGRRWNERWIYRSEHGDDVERVVLWHRYDLVGLFRVKPDGTLEEEPVPEA